MRSFRIDFSSAPLTWQKTPQGGLRVPAYLSRTGVFTYRTADGKEFKEARFPDQVFDEAALASFRNAPLTVDHPGAVTADNWKAVAVGHVAEDVRATADGRYLAATVLIQDSATVAKVLAGELKELSCGYDCDLEMTPGHYDGENYDAIQRNIRGNHVAIGPESWGRAGSEVALRMDGASTTYTTEVIMPTNTDATIPVITGAPVAAPPVKFKAAVRELLAKTDSEVATVPVAELEAVKGQLAAAQAQIATLTAELTPAALDSKVAARVRLNDSARSILGAEFDCSGQSDDSVMAAAITKAVPGFKADGKSSDFLRGMFEAVCAKGLPSAGLAQLHADSANPSAPMDPIDAAKSRQAERNANAWKVTK